jgi:hypothetical protein
MSKWQTNDQDQEDFEQEKLIERWLERAGKSGSVELVHISSKGTARNTLIKASVSLDQRISETGEGTGTFADVIAGSDGRDLDFGESDHDPEVEAREQIFWNLSALGFEEGEVLCLVKILKLSIQETSSPSRTFRNDLEW